jgi:hypothetical protein
LRWIHNGANEAEYTDKIAPILNRVVFYVIRRV